MPTKAPSDWAGTAKQQELVARAPGSADAVRALTDRFFSVDAPPAKRVVAFAARSVLRVWGLLNLVEKEAGSTPDFEDLLRASRDSLKAAYDFCAGAPHEAVKAEAGRLYREFARLASAFDRKAGELPSAAWSAGTAAARLKDCLLYPQPDAMARNARSAAEHASGTAWGCHRGAARWGEVASLHAAFESDLDRLATCPFGEAFDLGELGPLGRLWPATYGAAPDWYRQLLALGEGLTGAGECWTVLDMPSKDPQPGRTDPALQQVLDAFDATSLPRPPIRKVSGLDTPGAFKLLGAFEKYLDRVGDPVVNGVRTILAELRDRSFESIDETRAFVDRVQSILDRAGYAVVCPSCSEPGRLDVATSKHLPAGAIRVKHGRESTHGGGGLITSYEFAPKP